jgi:nitroreductase
MFLLETMYNCRAMRRLDTKPVPAGDLQKLIEAANQAPSGSNMQNGRWLIVQDPAVKQSLADLNRKGVEAYIGPQIDNMGSLPHQPEDKRRRMADGWFDLLLAARALGLGAAPTTHHPGIG